jgi:hypothetical protein
MWVITQITAMGLQSWADCVTRLGMMAFDLILDA